MLSKHSLESEDNSWVLDRWTGPSDRYKQGGRSRCVLCEGEGLFAQSFDSGMLLQRTGRCVVNGSNALQVLRKKRRD
jgi:hypothetical protein